MNPSVGRRGCDAHRGLGGVHTQKAEPFSRGLRTKATSTPAVSYPPVLDDHRLWVA